MKLRTQFSVPTQISETELKNQTHLQKSRRKKQSLKIKHMSEKQMLVFDCETNGLLHDLSEIHCIAIFDSQKEETFVFNNQGGDCYPITEGLHWLSEC